MKSDNKFERGQALILVVFAIVGLIAITGLVVDGGLAYANNRDAQGAADAAAFAAGLAKVRGNTISMAAQAAAQNNGFDNSQVTVNNPPEAGCNGQISPHAGDSNYIQVLVKSQVDTTFSGVVGVNELNNCVEAVTYVDPPINVSLFDGNAIVGLNPTLSSKGAYPCGFDSGSSNAVEWKITGGGIFSNGCAYSKNNDSVDLGGQCVTTVGPADNFTCSQPNQGSSATITADDVDALMPPTPACDGTATGGINVSSDSEKPGGFYFENGVYCVDDFEIFHKKDVTLNNAVLYITDIEFNLVFAGQGGFGGTAPTDGPYAGYYMIIAPNDTPCEKYQDNSDTQSLEFRGHGTADIVGTIFAPTSCIDFRGNSEGYTTRSQIIGYTVSSNGESELDVNYSAGENAQTLKPPTIQLVK